MKAIWIHGMGGSPNQEKMAIMEQYGLTTHSLHLDYSKESRRFEILCDYCKGQKIELLVGSSFGGFLGFWLSEELGIPCLLLNPAVSIRGKAKTKPLLSNMNSPLCMVAVGDQDDKIDHERTLLFMEQDAREGKKIVTKVWKGEGHGFSNNTFKEILEWGLALVEEHQSIP